jgi:hypothetical protein
MRAGSALNPTTNDTSTTAPTHVSTVFTAGANSSKVDQIRMMQVASSAAAGIINVFIYDGTNYWLIDLYAYGISTLSATAEPQPIDLYYTALLLKSGQSIVITNTANSAALFAVTAFGADF